MLISMLKLLGLVILVLSVVDWMKLKLRRDHIPDPGWDDSKARFHYTTPRDYRPELAAETARKRKRAERAMRRVERARYRAAGIAAPPNSHFRKQGDVRSQPAAAVVQLDKHRTGRQ